MLQTGRGGSLLGFIFGGLILTLFLVGGVYFLHQRSDTQASLPTSLPPTQDPPENPRQNTPSSAPKTSDNTPQKPSPEPPMPQPQHHSSAVLPQTGTTETITSAFILALVGGSVVSYLRSRRALSL